MSSDRTPCRGRTLVAGRLARRHYTGTGTARAARCASQGHHIPRSGARPARGDGNAPATALRCVLRRRPLPAVC